MLEFLQNIKPNKDYFILRQSSLVFLLRFFTFILPETCMTELSSSSDSSSDFDFLLERSHSNDLLTWGSSLYLYRENFTSHSKLPQVTFTQWLWGRVTTGMLIKRWSAQCTVCVVLCSTWVFRVRHSVYHWSDTHAFSDLPKDRANSIQNTLL